MSGDFLAGFRNPEVARSLVERIRLLAAAIQSGDASGKFSGGQPINLMEVCGTHTVSIFRSGLRSILDTIPGLRLLSGPGCPVCVTSVRDVDAALAIASRPDVTFATFGDMVKVPGTVKSFARLKAEGADIRLVYSPMELIAIAESNPKRQVSFFSVGFETTTPGIAYALKRAKSLGIRNLTIVAANKVVPPALAALCKNPDLNLHGFILPGHVSTITGAAPFKPIAERFGIPCAIAGFEPVDILSGIAALLAQIREGRAQVEILYARAVPPAGNMHARAVVSHVFMPCDAEWRGIGVIPRSGLKLNAQYEDYDALRRFEITSGESRDNPLCRCGDVLIGKSLPTECPLFGKGCDPEKPIGACMVSSEGTCSTYYRYAGKGT
ncbi:MAG: hydrogenase formation protein HypD [bacterium]|jgi:hydrogenase expression/formation protein HypD